MPGEHFLDSGIAPLRSGEIIAGLVSSTVAIPLATGDDRLLVRLGIANAISASFGGVTSGINIGPSLVNRGFGAKSFVSVLVNAAVLLMAATVLVNLSPPNPYFTNTLRVWHQGHFLNFNGLTRLVSALWPFAALAYLLGGPARGTTG